MENAVWDGIRSELSALKERVAALEKQVDEYERIEAAKQAAGIPAEEVVEASAEEVGTPAAEALESPKVEEGTPEEEQILTGPADSSPIDLGIELPDFGQGIRSINDVQSRKVRKRLMESSAATPKWKTDLPGTPVRNIISAISLNDRVLMINKLFGEDPQLFQQTLADLNAMERFADAEDYISGHFSGWKMDSEPVYRFMMAVRRKLNR